MKDMKHGLHELTYDLYHNLYIVTFAILGKRLSKYLYL